MKVTMPIEVQYPSGDGKPVAETFAPKGQWIREGLRGYQLVQGTYQVIDDQISSALGLRLFVQDEFIAFYRLDTGEKLLLPVEMKAALMAESQRRELAEQEVLAARQEALAAKQEAIELAAQLAAYKKSFGTLESDD
jgi:hypothetical protein